jgi:radical SAM protein (TIGR01212 family)
MIYSWGHSRRFNAYSNYFKQKFGARVQKLSLNAGFTCPNRDGTLGTGGCTFCNNSAFNPSYCEAEKTIAQQLNEGIEFHENRYKSNGKYLAYFQAYTNTHASNNELEKLYNEALAHPQVIGLVIGTRPDCIDEDKLDLIQHISEKNYVKIEYGVESVYNSTLERINRGHTFEQSVEAIEKSSKRRLRVGAHFIFGLPGESKEQMIASTKLISQLPLHSIKFHQLQIINETALAKEYEQDNSVVHLMKAEEYLELVIKIVERLNPAFIIERISGEAPPRHITANRWGMRNDQVIQLFEKKMEEQNTWQGKLYTKQA